MTFYTASDRENAPVMDKLDRQLRAASGRDFGGKRWMDAGVQFLREGLRRNCLQDLNGLGDLLGSKSWLSERSIDELFESGQTTDAFVQRLRLESSVDPAFGELLRQEFGERLFTRPLAVTGDMFG